MNRQVRVLRVSRLALGVMGLVLGGCGGIQPQGEIPPGEPVEVAGDVAIYQLTAESFNALPLQMKRYAWHLYRAGIAGRDVTYDQLAPRGLEIRRLLESLMSRDGGRDGDFPRQLREYAVRFWLGSGNYDPWSRRKFVPGFGYEAFVERAMGLSGVDGEYLEGLKPYLFESDFEPQLVVKAGTGDVLVASAVNLYAPEVARQAAEEFPGVHSLNSRLGYADGKVVEEVYRAGGDGVPPGRMAQALGKVTAELEAALAYAPESSREGLREFIRYLRTGEPDAFRRHSELWVQDREPPVDYVAGFVEVYDDPLGRRGTFEVMVMVEDRAAGQAVRALGQDAAWFEQRMPWDEKYRKHHFELPAARAVELVGGFGDGGPLSPCGVNLPNFQDLRQTIGTKNFIVTNVLAAGSVAEAQRWYQEFLPTTAEREAALRDWSARRLALVALHEVTGHGSGWVPSAPEVDPDARLGQYASTLEECRADLAAYWFIGEPHLVELGLVPRPLDWEGAFTAMLAGALMTLRDYPEGDRILDDHDRATWLAASYLLERGAARMESIAGKRYLRLVDAGVAREVVGELLAEIMRIKGTGDYPAARELVETYGVGFEPALRDEVVQRAGAVGFPRRKAFIMPELELVRNRMGGVKDVRVVYPRDFVGQMLKWGTDWN